MLQISLLGPPIIGIDDERRDLPGYRPMALLAYFLLTEKPTAVSTWLIYFSNGRMIHGLLCAGR